MNTENNIEYFPIPKLDLLEITNSKIIKKRKQKKTDKKPFKV